MILLVLLLATLAIGIALVSNIKTRRVLASHPAIGEFVEVNGKRLHYIKRGTGPEVIIIHGAGGNLRDFSFSLIEKLEKNYTVIAFDRPAHGHSDVFDPIGENITLQAEIITTASRKLGLKKPTVIGYSFGGVVGLHMALNNSDYLNGLLMVSAPVHLWPGEGVDWTYRTAALPIIGPALMHAAYAILPETYFRNAYAGVFRPQSAPDGFLDHIGVGLTVRPRTFVANSRQIVPLADENRAVIPRYPELTLPIEIVHGTADNSVSHIYHSVDFVREATNTNVRATYVDGIGHGTHQLAQDEIIAALKRLEK